jgi:hypothetical protein
VRIQDEPSALPLGGWILGSLISLVSALLASGGVVTLAIAIAVPTGLPLPVGSAVSAGMAPLLLLISAVFYRSTRRHHYSMSVGGAIALVIAIWLCASVAAVLLSFGDPFAENGVDMEIVLGAHAIAQGVLWGCVWVLTVNICSSLFLSRDDLGGRVAQIVFLSSAVVFSVATILPAAGSLILAGT